MVVHFRTMRRDAGSIPAILENKSEMEQLLWGCLSASPHPNLIKQVRPGKLMGSGTDCEPLTLEVPETDNFPSVPN